MDMFTSVWLLNLSPSLILEECFDFRRMFIATAILSLQSKQILYNWQVFHPAYKIHMRVSF